MTPIKLTVIIGAALIVLVVLVVGDFGTSDPLAQISEEAGDDEADEEEPERDLGEEMQNALRVIGESLSDYTDLQKRLNKVRLPGIEPYREALNGLVTELKGIQEVFTSAAPEEDKEDALEDYINVDWGPVNDGITAAEIGERLSRALKRGRLIVRILNKFSQSPPLANSVGLNVDQMRQAATITTNDINQVKALVDAGNLGEAVDFVQGIAERGGNVFPDVDAFYEFLNELLDTAGQLKRLQRRAPATAPEVVRQVSGTLAPVLDLYYQGKTGEGYSLFTSGEDESLISKVDEILEAAIRSRR